MLRRQGPEAGTGGEISGKECGTLRLEADISGHLDAAAALHGALFTGAWSAAALTALLAVPGTGGAAAVCDMQTGQAGGPAYLAGFVMFRSLGDFAEILTLAVAPDERRRGIGRLLMHHAIRMSREAGAGSLLLEVQDGNHAAIGLYGSLGMQAFDRRPGYYSTGDGGHADAIVMRLPLDGQGLVQ